MKIRNLVAAAAAVTMTASPVLAASANPASSLSVAGARAGAPSAKANAIGGGTAGIYALVILAGVAAIIAVAATNDDDDNSDSN